MTARFEVGELVDVVIKGARIVEADATGVMVEAKDMDAMWLDLSAVTVTRVAPKEWPPRSGDVWRGVGGERFFARATDDDDVILLSERTHGGNAWPNEMLASYGPAELVWREGWSPKPEPAGPPAAEPEPDQRAEKIAGLRELADWFEANPDVPLPYWTTVEVSMAINNFDLADRSNASYRAELIRVAGVVGAEPRLDDSHPGFYRRFRGASYRVFYIPRDEPTEDIALGVGEVADPAEGSGSATAPVETSRAGDTDAAPEASAVATTQPGDADSPAGPAASVDDPPGDAVHEDSRPQDRPGPAAVTPDVWVSIRRRGIHYHGFHGLGTPGQYTACGRAARANGTLLPLAEATAFGAVPCPRCYAEQVAA